MRMLLVVLVSLCFGSSESTVHKCPLQSDQLNDMSGEISYSYSDSQSKGNTGPCIWVLSMPDVDSVALHVVVKVLEFPKAASTSCGPSDPRFYFPDEHYECAINNKCFVYYSKSSAKSCRSDWQAACKKGKVDDFNDVKFALPASSSRQPGAKVILSYAFVNCTDIDSPTPDATTTLSTTTTTTKTPPKNGPFDLHMNLAAFISAGSGIILLVIIGVCCWCCCKKRRSN